MGPVYRDLELERHGATYVWPENQFGHVFPDGRALVCSRNLDTTVERIARFSKRDAETFREIAHGYRRVLEEGMIPAMFSPPGPPSQDLIPLETMGTDGLGLIRQFLSSPNHVARDLFETPEVQTWVGFWVAQLAGTGDVFGLGANYPVMIAGSLEPWGWAICKGGSEQLARAMARCLEENGGEIRVNAPVARIEIDADGARSVKLEDGEVIPVDGILVSNLDPKHTFLELVGEQDLGETMAHAAARWRYDVMSMFCVYLALDAPVRWKAAEFEPAVQRCFAVSMCESLDVLDDNASDCRLGVPPRQPGLFSVHPSIFEPSLCPPGKESCFCEQIAPYELRDGGHEAWEDLKAEYADLVLDRWRPYLVDGLEREAIVGQYISSPIDIERVMPSMKHGDWNHGEMSQDQLGVFRPFHEYPPYRTGFNNVYMCGASTHPGGSIGGACGYNAATVIAADLDIDRWWT
jgi:phytoene dehydrogenase-like protein